MAAAAEIPGGLRPPQRSFGDRAFDILVWGGIALLLVIGFREAEISKFGDLLAGGGNMRQFGAEFVRPNFHDLLLYVTKMWQTVQMALWGTAFAIALAIPL